MGVGIAYCSNSWKRVIQPHQGNSLDFRLSGTAPGLPIQELHWNPTCALNPAGALSHNSFPIFRFLNQAQPTNPDSVQSHIMTLITRQRKSHVFHTCFISLWFPQPLQLNSLSHPHNWPGLWTGAPWVCRWCSLRAEGALFPLVLHLENHENGLGMALRLFYLLKKLVILFQKLQFLFKMCHEDFL